MDHQSPLVLGFQGTEFTPQQLTALREIKPYGLMVMRRNVTSRQQITRLNEQFREAVGREDAIITTDQEGGRIQHLEGPDWPRYPIYGKFHALLERDFALAQSTMRRCARALASDMASAGFNANCGPVIDLCFSGASEVISDRSFGTDAQRVTAMGEQIIAGFMESGITPMIKHIPGHGRAMEDSHLTRPVVEHSLQELDESDFLPFRQLNHCPWAMVSHVVYAACDALPASVSKAVVEKIIRQRIGFEGVLISDCVYMESLTGAIADRCQQVQQAGVDLVLSCHGEPQDWYLWHEKLVPLGAKSLARLALQSAKVAAFKRQLDPDPAATMAAVWELLNKYN
ncbi:MAG: beta-N-acetylhexosaminidase [Oceanospirillaceae bacterium]|nr:beta-N-acetylhexosaminidase [Oceanospirillaceae bacterium]